ncbi:MAG: HAMP domain-containing histidine kinase [Lachnospiraceae bacterium]|nr:HAMP domain-containing histidine kinase [Lachnospiraceae bacterium]
MKSTLLYKILLGYLLLITIGVFALNIISDKLIYPKVLENKTEYLYENSNYLANTTLLEYYKGSKDINYLDNELLKVSQYTDTRILLINSNNLLILDTHNPNIMYSPKRIDAFDSSVTNVLYQQKNFHNYFNEDYITVFSPVNYGYSVKGYVCLNYSIEDIEQKVNDITNLAYIVMLLFLSMTFIILIIFFFEIYKPIKVISNASREYASGNLKYRIPISGDDEFGRLASSLNYMASELEDADDFQKKFIANISHDFRSPLTSIKGYLNAILDGVVPQESQEKYLNIVISETERLEKLTQSMLTLNNMSTKSVRLDITTFNITQKVKQIIETFEGLCKSRNIKFELTFSSKDIYVLADLEKIQQVIYNLIDNSIKFSHNNSSIYISITEKGEKAFFSIKDTGIGIPKDSLNKIWDRFYKTDLSRGKDKKGTGLGLSITKEIIQAHNSNIDVISTEGVGTEFIFALDIAKETSKV